VYLPRGEEEEAEEEEEEKRAREVRIIHYVSIYPSEGVEHGDGFQLDVRKVYLPMSASILA
jgi:hypothetical protein